MRAMIQDLPLIASMRRNPSSAAENLLKELIDFKIVKKKVPKEGQTELTRAALSFLKGGKRKKKEPTSSDEEPKKKKVTKPKPEKNGEIMTETKGETKTEKKSNRKTEKKGNRKTEISLEEWTCGLCRQPNSGTVRIAVQPCGHVCLCFKCHQTSVDPGFVTLNLCFVCTEAVASVCFVQL